MPKPWGCVLLPLMAVKEKEGLCKKMGAEASIDFTTCKDIPAEVMKITTWRYELIRLIEEDGLMKSAHGVIVTAATKAGYE
jgi:propanol-preferring alcohol dehydrogenase